MSTTIKPTVTNIISLWFGVDTPLRQYRIRLNPELWMACQRTDRTFAPPAGVRRIGQYKKEDKRVFALAVQKELERSQVLTTQKRPCPA